MTATEILADLKVKAEQATQIKHFSPERWPTLPWASGPAYEHIIACSPDRILALVAWARRALLVADQAIHLVDEVERAAPNMSMTKRWIETLKEEAHNLWVGHLDAGEEEKR